MIVPIIVLIVVMVAIVWLKVSVADAECNKSDKRDGCFVKLRHKVRVALLMDNSVLLSVSDGGVTYDLAIESDVGRGESVERVLSRLPLMSDSDTLPDVRFCLKHNSIYRNRKCVSYLFVLHLSNADVGKVHFDDAVWWTFEDVKKRMGANVFTNEFEEEFPHLEMVHDMWKITKESKGVAKFDPDTIKVPS